MTTILIVEDAEELREHIVEYLMLKDYEVLEAADGQAGYEVAVQQRPDLILCDVIMPELDGYGMLEKIRAHPEVATMPFIFLTARTSSSDMRQALQLGADDYLTKPFRFEDLQAAIETQLSNKTRAAKQPSQATDAPQKDDLFRQEVLPTVTHDIKSLMTVIISSVFLMREYADKLSPEQRDRHLMQVLRSSYQSLEMLDDMMTFGRLDTDSMQLDAEPFAISEMLTKLIGQFEGRNSSNHQIVLDCGECDGLQLEADEGLVYQAVANLLSNALKYSPDESTVRIELQQHDNCLKIMVRDQGAGVPIREKDSLFELFHRGANAGNKSGAGLGLAIVRLVASAHSGSVSLESAPGEGATFTLSLPLHAAGPAC